MFAAVAVLAATANSPGSGAGRNPLFRWRYSRLQRKKRISVRHLSEMDKMTDCPPQLFQYQNNLKGGIKIMGELLKGLVIVIKIILK
jgi:hypothetical protein